MEALLICSVIAILSVHLVSSYDAQCPSGLEGTVEIFNCTCYQFSYPKQSTYNNAVDHGKCGDGHLAHILDEETNDFIRSVLYRIAAQPGVDINYGFWLGATDKQQEDVWRWEPSGEPLKYTDWAHDEPDTPLGIPQDCLYMAKKRDWKWASLQCSIYPNIPYICQYKATDCVVGSETDKKLYGGLTLTELIAICVGAIIALVIILVVACALAMVCARGVKRTRKRRQSKIIRRSMKFYRGNPTTSIYRESRIPEGASTSQSEETVPLDEGMNLKVKGGDYPTAASIQAEAESDLVVDVETGRQTIKRSNVPSTSRHTDKASTKSLKSFNMDASIPIEEDRVSMISNENNDSWNLDFNKVDKSEKLMDKSIDLTK